MNEQTVNLKINNFEGPLDLLLHLISKKKMEIHNVNISLIVDQYLDFLKQEEHLNMDTASEFISMATKLIYLKSVMLLPQKEEAESIQKELVGQLIEYQLCKQIAQKLKEKNGGFYRFIKETLEFEEDKTYENSHSAVLLLKAYYAVIQKNQSKLPPKQQEFDNYVATPVVSVDSRILFLIEALKQTNKMKLYNIFTENQKSENVATFLALLEMIKEKRIEIDETGTYISFKSEVK